MPFGIDFIEYFDKPLKLDEIKRINHNRLNTFSILTQSETVPENLEIEYVTSSEKILNRARQEVQNRTFSPENVLNLKKLSYDGKLDITTNLTNYASVVAARKIIEPEFTEEESLSVLNKVAPVGGTCVIFSEENQYALMGRRSNVLVGEKYHGFPGFIVGEESNLYKELIEEAEEEAGIRNLNDMEVNLVGVSRGRNHGVNPNFNYAISSNVLLDQIWRGVWKSGQHDMISVIQLDEEPYEVYIKENIYGVKSSANKSKLEVYDKMVDVGMGGMLQVGRFIFGDTWYNNLLGELSESPYNIKVLEKNFFE